MNRGRASQLLDDIVPVLRCCPSGRACWTRGKVQQYKRVLATFDCSAWFSHRKLSLFQPLSFYAFLSHTHSLPRLPFIKPVVSKYHVLLCLQIPVEKLRVPREPPERPPFDLDAAVFLADFAFEAYRVRGARWTKGARLKTVCRLFRLVAAHLCTSSWTLCKNIQASAVRDKHCTSIMVHTYVSMLSFVPVFRSRPSPRAASTPANAQ